MLSSRVNENSQILYDREPRTRVQKVAPWLTVDTDAYPAVVDGKVVWILDGYTTTDHYPNSEKRSLSDMTSDALNPRTAYATLPTDEINYMRNSVKAVVDAYDGTVQLYAWDRDPILEAWERGVPGGREAEDGHPAAPARAHALPRGHVQGAARHARAPTTCRTRRRSTTAPTSGSCPQDPENKTRKQAPYRLSVRTPSDGPDPVFSLTSVFVPNKRQNLASFISVDADAVQSRLRHDPDPAAAEQHPDPGPVADREQLRPGRGDPDQAGRVHQGQLQGDLRQPADAAGRQRPALRAAALRPARVR